MANHVAPECPHGHPTPTAAHRTARGFCRECQRRLSRQHRKQVRAVLAEARRFASTLQGINT